MKKQAEPVSEVNDAVRQLLDDMLDTMYDAPGIGLAAPQVGILKEIIVVDVSDEEDDTPPYKMINPRVIWESEEIGIYEEGCLSVPKSYGEVERPSEIKVRYLDENGAEQELHADGLLATCIQHEIDHLKGTLFIDHLSRVKRGMIMRKLTKIKKAG